MIDCFLTAFAYCPPNKLLRLIWKLDPSHASFHIIATEINCYSDFQLLGHTYSPDITTLLETAYTKFIKINIVIGHTYTTSISVCFLDDVKERITHGMIIDLDILFYDLVCS